MLALRDYQQAAVDAVYRYLREHDGNPAVVTPTASGKSVMIARIASDAVQLWNGRVLVLAHVQELLEQNADKIRKIAPELPVGIYSAGLKQRDTLAPVIVAGIQSAYRRAGELGHFDLVMIDEAHLLAPSGEGMYRTLLGSLKATNPNVRIIGFTATPFRLSSGPICGPENILTEICYEVGVRELIVQGFLCPLKTKAGREKADTSGLHVRGGEFIAGEVETLMDDERLVESACREIIDLTRERKSVLVFASGVQHGNHVAKVLERMGQKVATVFGDTLDFEREQVLADFRAGRLKFLVNVNVLTTGFDAPNIDCVAMLRPTLSPGLWVQCCGRGFRLHPSKKDCLILDYGGNAMRHGPVDLVKVEPRQGGRTGSAPAKECPGCQTILATGYLVCPHCGHQFGREQAKHEANADNVGVLSGQVTETDYDVQGVEYRFHTKHHDPDAPPTMRVDYCIGWHKYQSEWVCFEHSSYARAKAESWWRKRSNVDVPLTVDEAITLATAGALATTKRITVRHVAGEKYARISAHVLGEKPLARPEIAACPFCGSTERSMGPGAGRYASSEQCANCNAWLAWTSDAQSDSDDWNRQEPEPAYLPIAEGDVPF